jgi:sugar fermentation stimulation protein A
VLLPFDRPLIAGILVRRYKRFLADIVLADGREIVAHCPNSGAMTTCSTPGSPVWVSAASNPTRKLPWTWEMVQANGVWVGVNTQIPNTAVAAFIAAGQIPALRGYATVRREVVYGSDGRSRIDILLQGKTAADTCHVEVKNATFRVGQHAAFPDAVTLRGQKHLRELTALVAAGQRATMFYFVGRSDCQRFRPADEVDPTYGRLLRVAAQAGVAILAYQMQFSRAGVALGRRLPVDLDGRI